MFSLKDYLHKHSQEVDGTIVLSTITKHFEIGHGLGGSEYATHVHKVFAILKHIGPLNCV